MILAKLLMELLPGPYMAKQFKKPHGAIGKLIGKMMNKGNLDICQFTIEQMAIHPNDRILEIGYGGGYTLDQLANKITTGFINGVDISKDMLVQATRYNFKHIKAKKMRLTLSNVSKLPYRDNQFDKVVSINTLYFWDDPNQYLTEIKRVLKPSGTLFLGYRPDTELAKITLTQHEFTRYSPNQVETLLKESSFKHINQSSHQGPMFSGICTTGEK